MDKDIELIKYRDLVLTTLDYYVENFSHNHNIRTEYLKLKVHVEEHFVQGKLSTLKKWFKELTFDFIEDGDFHFNEYLKKTTKYEIDIFESYFKRIEKIIDKGQIKTESQFHEIQNYVDHLIQNNSPDKELIKRMNEILLSFEKLKSE
ncbi:hypothetical protein AS589_14620 [Empedobacter brevis]|uniref:hypothetical protein n=1 Tax=Empedobacter brevis TaxID=247 RepID=UPI00131F6267|nr:hypothetical protein [Empedobacter brevis]QHC85928.1 hypothetical protein AS589_14620 [Empedobacter brevis]